MDMIQKKINNWIIQFLKNETKTFLVLQKILIHSRYEGFYC